MLQTSQIEKPRCSAKIDQMRLRRAMALPVDFQNCASSGFQSEIQVGFRLLINVFLSGSVNARQQTPPPTLESVSPRAAALPVQSATRRAAPAAATASLRLYKLRANQACGDKVSINQRINRQGRHLDITTGHGRSALPKAFVQKLCAVQNAPPQASIKAAASASFAGDHFNSSAAVTTDWATSAIFLLSFIAVLRSRA